MSSKLGKTSSLVDSIFRYLFTLPLRRSLAKIEFILRFLSHNIGCIINSPQVIEVQIAFISDYFPTGNDKNFCSLWCQNMIVMVSKQQKNWVKILRLRDKCENEHNNIQERHCHIIWNTKRNKEISQIDWQKLLICEAALAAPMYGIGTNLRACLISRRVWIGEWIFCPARQKSAGILTDGKDF